MKVIFAADVLDDPGSWLTLDRIVYHFLDERHVWSIDDPEKIEESPWLQDDVDGRMKKRNLETLQKCFTMGAYPTRGARMDSITLHVTLHSDSECRLTPDEARRCLDAPAYVVVENAESDGAFLEAMIHGLKREKLLEAHTEGWWKIDSRGGSGEIVKHIEQIRAETIGPLRAFVLVDSDRLNPGYEKKTIHAIENYCRQNNGPYAVLQKREIENYLPVHLLQQIPRKRKKVYKAFLRLEQEQRDYYDMKRGFEKGHRDHAKIPVEQQDLFSHVPRNVLDDLCGGFGNNVWRLFKTSRDLITEESIRLTCINAPDEIGNILDGVESIL